MLTPYVTDTYESLTKFDIEQIENLIWNADNKLTYDESRAVEKLKGFYDSFQVGELEVEDIIELINTHTDDHGVDQIIDAIKEWGYKTHAKN